MGIGEIYKIDKLLHALPRPRVCVKVTGHFKIEFFVVFPPSVAIAQFVPFGLCIKNPQNLSKVCKKGTNREILSLNNRRLGRLKEHFIQQK